MKRILVCGGRDYTDMKKVYDTLDELHPTCIIHGMARGADALAGAYAQHWQLDVDEYPADWNKYGKGAGYIRNKQMLDEGKPDLVVAFPGGKGTAMMIKLAKEAGTPVIEVD